VKSAFDPVKFNAVKVQRTDLDGAIGTGPLVGEVPNHMLATYLDKCPAPPPRVNICWRKAAQGCDNFGFEVVQTDRSVGSVYLCVARYNIVDGAPLIPAAGAHRDRFERFRTHHRGNDIVSVIPGRGNRDARLAYYQKQARAVGVALHRLLARTVGVGRHRVKTRLNRRGLTGAEQAMAHWCSMALHMSQSSEGASLQQVLAKFVWDSLGVTFKFQQKPWGKNACFQFARFVEVGWLCRASKSDCQGNPGSQWGSGPALPALAHCVRHEAHKTQTCLQVVPPFR
jgi:hypothetical protein